MKPPSVSFIFWCDNTQPGWAAAGWGVVSSRAAVSALDIEFRAIRRGSAALREQAVDETLDVRGVDVAVAIGVGGAGRRAVEENVDEELDV